MNGWTEAEKREEKRGALCRVLTFIISFRLDFIQFCCCCCCGGPSTSAIYWEWGWPKSEKERNLSCVIFRLKDDGIHSTSNQTISAVFFLNTKFLENKPVILDSRLISFKGSVFRFDDFSIFYFSVLLLLLFISLRHITKSHPRYGNEWRKTK